METAQAFNQPQQPQQQPQQRPPYHGEMDNFIHHRIAALEKLNTKASALAHRMMRHFNNIVYLNQQFIHKVKSLPSYADKVAYFDNFLGFDNRLAGGKLDRHLKLYMSERYNFVQFCHQYKKIINHDDDVLMVFFDVFIRLYTLINFDDHIIVAILEKFMNLEQILNTLEPEEDHKAQPYKGRDDVDQVKKVAKMLEDEHTLDTYKAINEALELDDGYSKTGPKAQDMAEAFNDDHDLILLSFCSMDLNHLKINDDLKVLAYVHLLEVLNMYNKDPSLHYCLGNWRNPTDGQLYIDISMAHKYRKEDHELNMLKPFMTHINRKCVDFNQKSLFTQISEHHAKDTTNLWHSSTKEANKEEFYDLYKVYYDEDIEEINKNIN